ncbi:cyclin-dependent protein kinase 9-like protein kinase [Encephalitozoon intestinalis ATCC 50506]|uniref:Cyclin-dependent protein kinase 9-like protein kinase n=1 Tax=Encephalitozoon intestinalis (strain ATCC 50506) TaxID=876142 RepID=E0SAF8_ENCIT|nr:cyclin-dependent protein kinase 9-like protein kinase [Encephalitozoon intestinalis ATCC 50506]ADM12583.1 cyclin-dependent protein kinase 9-like protein kinase [Encephalitozoon intestinalis ATCC 50506]UTX46440.1 cyclin-dependent protein kinase 9 [Encephalitozoon intestinalis]
MELPEEGEILAHKRFTVTEMSYEKIRVIGEGTFGQVILARKGRARYALKKVTKEKEGIPVTTIREIQVLRAMSHPSIIRLMEMVVEPGGDVYMVFPYFPYDLNRFIRNNRLAPEEVKHIFHQIAKGVWYIHNKGIMHRDLKSANILLDHKLNAAIADFGMARYVAKAGMHTPGTVTLWYRPPEILLGSYNYTYAVDIWSLGCILTEMYLGYMIFQGNTEISQLEMIIHACGSINENSYPGVQNLPGFRNFRLPQSPRRIEKIIESHDESAVQIISRMLCLDPSNRITIDQIVKDEYLKDRSCKDASNAPLRNFNPKEDESSLCKRKNDD